MKLSVQQIIVMMVATFSAVAAQAHSGHDHSAMSSSAIHAVFYMSIFAVVAMTGYFAVKAVQKKADK